VSDLDPPVERVILHCLEQEPEDRPADISSVSRALPGGDPLEAAIARQETPAADIVAGARTHVTLSRPLVAALGLAVVAGLVAAVWLAPRVQITGLVRPPHPPEVLLHKADEVLQLVGYDEPRVDWSESFRVDAAQLRYVARDYGPGRYATDRPRPLLFDSARAPWLLQPTATAHLYRHSSLLAHGAHPGEARVVLDADANLRALHIRPYPAEDPSAEATEPDWGRLFELAALDIDAFDEQPGGGNRRVWTGTHPGPSGYEAKVVGEHMDGRVSRFRVHLPWERAESKVTKSAAAEIDASGKLMMVLLFVLVAALLFVLPRVLKRNRDLRGAAVVGIALVALAVLRWLLTGHKTLVGAELWFGFARAVGWSLFFGLLGFLFYLLVEPQFRHTWPRALVSWVRILRGRVRDPLVARDVLAGSAYGVALFVGTVLAVHGGVIAARPDEFAASAPGNLLFQPEVGALMGGAALLANVDYALAFALWGGLQGAYALALVRAVVRLDVVAIALITAWVVVVGGARSGAPGMVLLAAVSGLTLWLLVRVGVLFHVTWLYAWCALRYFPLTADLGAWYSTATVVALVAVAAPVAFAAWVLVSDTEAAPA
jgi:serine/threonine-protein kinase